MSIIFIILELISLICLIDVILYKLKVVRNRETTKAFTPHCFTNAGLNLKDQDTSMIRNPFEISREGEQQQSKLNKNENDKQQVKTSINPDKVTKQLQISLPFQPTVGCRINFQDISLSQLSPSKLLAEKLVFSPTGLGTKQKKTTSLSIITEEDSTIDIGKELDRYQLELENSINEAKLNKTDMPSDKERKISNEVQKNKIDLVKNEETNNAMIKNIAGKNPFLCDDSDIKPEEPCNDDISEALNEDDSLEEIIPAPFVRSYRKPEVVCTFGEIDKKANDTKLTKDGKEKSTTNVGKLLRRSIRKLINPQQQQKTQSKEEISKDENIEIKINNKSELKMETIEEKPKQSKEKCNTKDKMQVNENTETNEDKDSVKLDEKDKVEEMKGNNQGFMNTIRRSLRRSKKSSNPVKNYTNLCFEDKENEVLAKEAMNASIVDTTERRLKLKSELEETEYLKIEDLAGERKPTGIRNSIRRTIFGRKNLNGHYFKRN